MDEKNVKNNSVGFRDCRGEGKGCGELAVAVLPVVTFGRPVLML